MLGIREVLGHPDWPDRSSRVGGRDSYLVVPSQRVAPALGLQRGVRGGEGGRRPPRGREGGVGQALITQPRRLRRRFIWVDYLFVAVIM